MATMTQSQCAQKSKNQPSATKKTDQCYAQRARVVKEKKESNPATEK